MFLAEGEVEKISTEPVDLLKSYKGIDKYTVWRSKRYYSEYGADYLEENLAWSADRILQICEESLSKKNPEGMVGASTSESGGPLVLKLMLDSIMDADGSTLRAYPTPTNSLH